MDLPVDRQHYQDPHWQDWWGPLPRWVPGEYREKRKLGGWSGRFVWPKDKKGRGKWGRFKDIMTGKGPDIWISGAKDFAPTRPDWSNWLEYDNLGYRNEHDQVRFTHPDPYRKYDFRTRKYIEDGGHRADVWSDVKWGRGPNPKQPLYIRDGFCREWTKRGPVYHPDDNDFRYHGWSGHFDWAVPEPKYLWDRWLDC